MLCLILCGCRKSDRTLVEVSEEYQYVITTTLDEPGTEAEDLNNELLNSTLSQAIPNSEYVKETASSFFWMEREGEAEIVRYAGNSNLVEVPSELLGSVVTIIGSHCFSDSTVSGIRLPNTVHTLADNAFNGAPHLETVYIPASVTTFGENLFGENTSVTIVVPENSSAQNYFDSVGIPVTLEP